MMTQRVSSAALMLLLLQTTAWTGVQGSCYFSRDFNYNAATRMIYCTEPSTNATVPYGTYLVTPDCFNCSCYWRELQCCGIGYQAGFIAPPPGQELVQDPGCDYHFEDASFK